MNITLYTNHDAAESAGLPISTWNWYRRRGVIPPGAIKVGKRTLYTSEQVRYCKERIEQSGYTKGFVGRKKGRSGSRFETY